MGFLHLLEQLCVADDTRSVPYLPTCLVQASDAAHDRAFRHICKLCDLLKRLPNICQPAIPHTPYERASTHHSLRPLIDDLDKPGLERTELLPRDLVPLLRTLDALRERVDRREPLLQLRRHDGFDVRLLLEDEAGEERDDLFGLVCGERVLEDELGEDELVR